MTVRKLALFELHDPPTEAEYQACAEVWQAGSFPWQWTVKHNVRWGGGNPNLHIGFKDKDGSLGYYSPTLHHINIDPIEAQGGLERFRLTLTHELTHLIDSAILNGDSRDEIHRLFHVGSATRLEDCPAEHWRNPTHQNSPSEAFANALPKLWCPTHSKGISHYGPHYFTELDAIWEVVMAETEDEYPFSDIEGTVHEEAILWAVGEGIVSGYSDGTFRPNEPATRAQISTMFRNYDTGRP